MLKHLIIVYLASNDARKDIDSLRSDSKFGGWLRVANHRSLIFKDASHSRAITLPTKSGDGAKTFIKSNMRSKMKDLGNSPMEKTLVHEIRHQREIQDPDLPRTAVPSADGGKNGCTKEAQQAEANFVADVKDLTPEEINRILTIADALSKEGKELNIISESHSVLDKALDLFKSLEKEQ